MLGWAYDNLYDSVNLCITILNSSIFPCVLAFKLSLCQNFMFRISGGWNELSHCSAFRSASERVSDILRLGISSSEQNRTEYMATLCKDC